MQTLEAAPAPAIARPRAAFERTLLPGFARWFVERIKEQNPDLLVPAETKGARLLEQVLRYARESLGVSIETPILYSTALAYTDRDFLRGARILILDDAVRTGQNIARHRERIERYGAKNISAVACIAYGGNSDYGTHSVECFRVVEDVHLYREYVWQLTELVVTRGLPPEVDHHVLTLRLPERLPVALETLREALAAFGQLSVDEWDAGSPAAMTLHFPELPGVLSHPREGDVCIEGANKIRFFPDPATGDIHVVPFSFPALDLPDLDSNEVGLSRAQELIRGWGQTQASIGELLVEQARTHDAEMVFRALSTVTELSFLCGLARVLARAFPAGEISLVSQRELCGHLYGPAVGELVADQIDQAVRAAPTEQPEPTWPGGGVAEGEMREILEPDVEVAEKTRQIAEHLKALYEQAAREQQRDPADPVGESLSEIMASLDLDKLLLSRCVDFGCAMTTLVPYVRVEPEAGGGIRVRRKYRVSEINRDPGEPYEDLNDVYQQLSEETVAFVAHYLSTHSRRWQGQPIRTQWIGWLVAILRPLVLERLGLALAMQWQGRAVTAVLRDGVEPRTLFDAAGSFVLRDGGVVPTERFKTLSAQEHLRIDRRGESVEVEDYLGPLVELIDSAADEGELRRVLSGWALSADGKLGLSYVEGDLAKALRRLEDLLKLSLREEPDPGTSVDTAGSVDELLICAREKLRLLQAGWDSGVHALWPQPTRRQRRLLGSIAAASDPATMYEFVEALADLTRSGERLAALLDRARVAAEAQDEAAARAGAVVVLADCARIRRALTWLESDGEGDASAPGEPREAIAAAAAELSGVLALVRSFLAAATGSYRGARGPRLVYDRPAQRAGTLLYADLSCSREHALRYGPSTNSEWKNSGLNLIVQWAKAFGGREMKDREGDAVWLEFAEHGDPSALCAAAVQRYAHALRSIGTPSQWWGFYVAVDHGELVDGDGGNVMGTPCDRIVELAKGRRAIEDALEDAVVSDDAAERCSTPLRERLSPLRHALATHEARTNGRAGESPLAHARTLDAEAAMHELCERIRTTAAAVAPVSAPSAPAPILVDDEAIDGIDRDIEEPGAPSAQT